MANIKQDEVLRVASEAERLQKDTYFRSVVDRLRGKANEEMTNLLAENTEKFIALAQMKEFLLFLEREIGADVHRGKVAREKNGGKNRIK